MTAAEYPHRLRLHGGRNTHAARPVNGGPSVVTACDYLCEPSSNHMLPDNAPVTCPRCKRELTR